MKILEATKRSKSESTNKVTGKFYPCFNDCKEIDLIINDNESIEYYTKNKNLTHDDFNVIYISKKEIRSSFENGYEFLGFNEFKI